MECASLMGSLALDLGWYHAGQTHKSRHTRMHAHAGRLHTNWGRQCKTGHRFGAHYEYQDSQVFNSQAVSGCCQHIKTPTHTRTLNTRKPTHIQQQLTQAVSLESGALYPATYFDIGYFHSTSPLTKVLLIMRCMYSDGALFLVFQNPQ